MKFEFVEFYPRTEGSQWGGRYVGTVHFYIVDCRMDVRGILVVVEDGSIRFKMPHFKDWDENGKPVKYPHIRLNDPKDHKEMLDFLHEEVKPIIRKRLNIYKKKPEEATAQT